MSSTTAPLTDVFAHLLERLRASKAGHFVAPRPSELTPRSSHRAPADLSRPYTTVPTRWGIDSGSYVPAGSPAEPTTETLNTRRLTRDQHRRNDPSPSSTMSGSGSFRLFD